MSEDNTTAVTMTTSNLTVDRNVTSTSTSSIVPSAFTTSMTPYPSVKLTNPDDGMSDGVIAGIVVGVIAVAVIVILVISFIVYRRRKQKAKHRERKPEETLPSTEELDKMDKEKLNTKQKKSKKVKKQKSSRRNKYEKDSGSAISIDPSSMPSFIAPEPPSHSYANQSFNYANLQRKERQGYTNENDGYERQKPNTAKLYSTTDGAEYYVVDDENGSQKTKHSKYQNSEHNNSNSHASVISNDYENLKEKPKNPRDFRESTPEDPQDVYEPMDQP